MTTFRARQSRMIVQTISTPFFQWQRAQVGALSSGIPTGEHDDPDFTGYALTRENAARAKDGLAPIPQRPTGAQRAALARDGIAASVMAAKNGRTAL